VRGHPLLGYLPFAAVVARLGNLPEQTVRPVIALPYLMGKLVMGTLADPIFGSFSMIRLGH
jgi:hypothetical protein